MKPIVALIYSRVSIAPEAENGSGLDAQEGMTRLHAQARGWPVVGSFRDDGRSGNDDEHRRPGLNALLVRARELHAEANDVVVVVYSVSRLALRQRLLWNLLEQNELLISSATESFDTTTPTGKVMLGMLSVFAKLDADMCTERTRDGLAEAKAQAKKLGGPNSMRLASALVLEVKKLSDDGASLQAIADQMNVYQVPTPSNWTESAKLHNISTVAEWRALKLESYGVAEDGKWVKSTVVRALKAAKEAASNGTDASPTRLDQDGDDPGCS